MKPSTQDREILRQLGGQLAEEAAAQNRAEKAALWQRNNDLDPVRKMVWINEVPWHELAAADDFLTCQCEDAMARAYENQLRRTLYQWHHFPADMILDDFISCAKVIHSTDIGLVPDDHTIAQDERGGIQSHHWAAQISRPGDEEKIQMPTVSYDAEATVRRKAVLEEVFDGILSVRVQGLRHIWFTPWDRLFEVVDMTEMMMAMIDNPDFVNRVVSRYVDALTHELDQYEDLGLLEPGLENIRIGSGGYAYTKDLPSRDADPGHAHCRDMWGCGNAQIFAEISPEMHWEFSLQHEMRWLERWGLTYYGCCEQLHNKMDILKKIPNLRKFSASPRCDIRKAMEHGADGYVLSVKPNPAIMAYDDWSEERARSQIRDILEATEGAAAELILKDISTVRDEPARLDAWARIAMEEVQGG